MGEARSEATSGRLLIMWEGGVLLLLSLRSSLGLTWMLDVMPSAIPRGTDLNKFLRFCFVVFLTPIPKKPGLSSSNNCSSLGLKYIPDPAISEATSGRLLVIVL